MSAIFSKARAHLWAHPTFKLTVTKNIKAQIVRDVGKMDLNYVKPLQSNITSSHASGSRLVQSVQMHLLISHAQITIDMQPLPRLPVCLNTHIETSIHIIYLIIFLNIPGKCTGI